MENVTISDVYNELKLLNKKVSHLESILIPEVEASQKDKKESEEASAEFKAGKTIKFDSIRED